MGCAKIMFSVVEAADVTTHALEVLALPPKRVEPFDIGSEPLLASIAHAFRISQAGVHGLLHTTRTTDGAANAAAGTLQGVATKRR